MNPAHEQGPLSAPSAARPVHLQPSLLGLVIVGGTLGTAARQALSLSVPTLAVFPLTIFLVNIVGSFTLGLLLEGLVRAGANTDRGRTLRLFAGTGFLGGFTTYSALTTETELLLRSGNVGIGILYAVGTLIFGLGAAALGVVVSARLRSRSTPAVRA